jgi:hypothetical protein
VPVVEFERAGGLELAAGFGRAVDFGGVLDRGLDGEEVEYGLCVGRHRGLDREVQN